MAENALMNLTEVYRCLQDIAKDVRENYIDQLENNDRRASGDLINSIRTQVRVGEKAFAVTMTLKEYWKWVEEDTRPHFPPVSAILKWVQIKPVIPRPFDNGKVPTQKQLAYLIARKISKVGTEGSHDLQRTKDNVLPWYHERLSKALAHDCEVYIRKVLAE